MITSAQVTVTAEQASLVVTAPALAAGTRDAHVTVTLAGQLIVGAVTSCTVIVWLAVDVLPH